MTTAASVCVSTYNRAASLDRLLTSLAAQDIADFEVVVCDNGSSDATSSVLAAWSERLPLTAVRLERNLGSSGGRNAAWRAATAAVVLFTDDDCIPTPSWVRRQLTAHCAGRVCVGRTEPVPGQTGPPFSRIVRVSDARFFPTCNVAYPRDLLASLDGFDERFRQSGEDTDLGLRAVAAGAEVVFVAEAVVHHEVRPSSWWAALREARKWEDLPLVVAEHPEAARPLLHSRFWWRRAHPLAVLAAAGLVLGRRQPAVLLALLPWLRFRLLQQPPDAPRRSWPWVLPGQLVLDVVEVATLARGSVRHRRLLL